MRQHVTRNCETGLQRTQLSAARIVTALCKNWISRLEHLLLTVTVLDKQFSDNRGSTVNILNLLLISLIQIVLLVI